MRKPLFAAVLGAFVMLGCEEPMTSSPDMPALTAAADAAAGDVGVRTYQVTITNLTSTQPLTPPLVATHELSVGKIFQRGQPASEGIKEIAENGNLSVLAGALMADPGVHAVVIAAPPSGPPPLLQNQSITFTIDGTHEARWLSWASMLICTNDGFTGLARFALPKMVGQSKTRRTASFDAGTEINTEDFADIVPPCQIFGGSSSGDAGTGMSDPALAENGVVKRHRGVEGTDDLDPAIHGWKDPTAEISVTRIS